MRKILVVLLSFVVVLLSLAIPAEAQYGGRFFTDEMLNRAYARRDYRGYGYGSVYNRGYNRSYGYGYGDPYLRQIVNLPDNLAACQVDFTTGQVTTCHQLAKTLEALEAHSYSHQGANEIIGTVHVHKSEWHFRPFDDTNGRLGTVSGGALGGLGGAAVGGAVGGRTGAAIGGVGAAVVSGILASRNSHDNCLSIDPVQSYQAQPVRYQQHSDFRPQVEPESEYSARNLPKVEGWVPATDPIGGLTWLTVNSTDFRAVVIDPNNGEVKLVPAWGSISLPTPSGEQPYVVTLLVPGRGSIDQISGQIRPTEDFSGWEIVAS